MYAYTLSFALGVFLDYVISAHLLFLAAVIGSYLSENRIHAAGSSILSVFYPASILLILYSVFSPQLEASFLMFASAYLLSLGVHSALGFVTGRLLRKMMK